MGIFIFAASRLRDAVDAVTSAGSHLEKLYNAFSYYKNYEKNIRKFQEEVEILGAVRAGVQQLIEKARNNGETILAIAENWLARADASIEEATSFLQDNSGQNQSGIFSRCEGLMWRYWQSKSAEEKIPEVIRLQEDGRFDRVSVLEPLMGTEFLSTCTSLEFESRRRIEENIHAFLKRSDISVIGLCGMAGVGKTTMVKKVAKRVKEENSFQVVVMAVISQMPELSLIQQQIAEGLGLQLEEQTVHIRAGRLRKRLMDMKSVLIILDDVWKRLDLEELGIPSQNSGLKMILTSRDRNAITSTQDHAGIVIIGVLTDEEAWDLFREKAGYSDDGPHLQYERARQVAKQCKGLPLALVVVGTALRNGSEPSWKDALPHVETNLPAANTPQVLQEVYVPLKWSYDQLESEKASGNSSGSNQNSGSEGSDLQLLTDQRKRKRMLSNLESARRSRMRKQRHLDDLMAQEGQLREENNQILTSINATTQQYLNREAENSVLRAQIMELSRRLESLNEIINYVNSDNVNGMFETLEMPQAIPENFMNNPWNLMCLNQPIIASADSLQY